LLNLSFRQNIREHPLLYDSAKDCVYFAATANGRPQHLSYRGVHSDTEREVFGPRRSKKDPNRIAYYRHSAMQWEFHFVPELDKMLGGGIPEGDSVLVTGSSGTGKSVLATQFIAEGISQGEPGIVAVFEERPQAYADRAGSFGLDLETPQQEGKLLILNLRPLDLSVDETMHEILDAVKRIGAKRLVIDSLAGFEMALSPGFREDFRESLYRMIFALTGIGVTILSTVEVDESFTEFPFSTYSISFLTDDIIRLRYVSIEGQLRKILVIIKMRGGNHSKDVCEYEITSEGGIVVGERLKDYQRLITGIPERLIRSGRKQQPSPKLEAKSKS
jgi:circadian clock protein KaiC